MGYFWTPNSKHQEEQAYHCLHARADIPSGVQKYPKTLNRVKASNRLRGSIHLNPIIKTQCVKFIISGESHIDKTSIQQHEKSMPWVIPCHSSQFAGSLCTVCVFVLFYVYSTYLLFNIRERSESEMVPAWPLGRLTWNGSHLLSSVHVPPPPIIISLLAF